MMKSEILKQLESIAENDLKQGIENKFEKDSQRIKKHSFDFSGIYFDFSKTHISENLMSCYKSYADTVDLSGMRHRLFSGEKINVTENRAVLHTLLRAPDNQGIKTEDPRCLEQASESEEDFFSKYEEIVIDLQKRNTPIRDIVHVGIGGSSLGTQLVFEALSEVGCSINVHFISNIDAHKLTSVLSNCDANSTLLIGVSKTFTTAETLQNINTIGTWFEANNVDSWREQFYAVTANTENAIAFGVNENNIVGFPVWVGGRYSVWSAVSLSAVIAFGLPKFKEFLQGAAEMDKHFYHSELDQNLCFIAAALDHYYANFLDVKSRAIFPYDHRLRSLVYYLPSVVVWGGVGTDVQHSVFQMMHQGTSIIPAEFILVKHPDHEYESHHSELLANGLAQTAALLSGQNLETVREVSQGKEFSEVALKAKVFSGQRPSTTMLLDRLTPKVLGALLAFYEHRTFCLGVLLNINSYDQMGVELGKRLANEISPFLSNKNGQGSAELDQSTTELIKRVTS